MEIVVNGQARILEQPLSVAGVLETLDVDMAEVAVEHNVVVLPRTEFAEKMLAAGDALEVVRFVCGG